MKNVYIKTGVMQFKKSVHTHRGSAEREGREKRMG